MKDEIKEIITEMQLRNGRYIMCKNEDISFSDEDHKAHLLLDYITNLQEAIETIKNTNKLLIQQKAQLQDDLDMLDNRIDKAIEYIKENACYDKECNMCCDDLWTSGCDEVIEILQGKSDE